MTRIAGYLIDAAEVEEHNFTAEVTDRPVENGSPITDHVRLKPIEITIEGVVSNAPLDRVAVERDGAGSYTEEFSARLRELWAAREPFAVETSFGIWDNMVITSLSMPQDADTGDALEFRLGLRQVTIVELERTVVQVSVPRAARKSNKGHKPTKNADGDEAARPTEERESILSSLTGWGR